MLKNAQKDFIQRHIGPSEEEQKIMLKELGFKNLDDLIENTVPEKILFKDELDIGDPNSLSIIFCSSLEGPICLWIKSF